MRTVVRTTEKITPTISDVINEALFNKKKALSGLIQVNDDEERKGGQAGCQL